MSLCKSSLSARRKQNFRQRKWPYQSLWIKI